MLVSGRSMWHLFIKQFLLRWWIIMSVQYTVWKILENMLKVNLVYNVWWMIKTASASIGCLLWVWLGFLITFVPSASLISLLLLLMFLLHLFLLLSSSWSFHLSLFTFSLSHYLNSFSPEPPELSLPSGSSHLRKTRTLTSPLHYFF